MIYSSLISSPLLWLFLFVFISWHMHSVYISFCRCAFFDSRCAPPWQPRGTQNITQYLHLIYIIAVAKTTERIKSNSFNATSADNEHPCMHKCNEPKKRDYAPSQKAILRQKKKKYYLLILRILKFLRILKTNYLFFDEKKKTKMFSIFLSSGRGWCITV